MYNLSDNHHEDMTGSHRYSFLSRAEALYTFPLLKSDGLVGSIVYRCISPVALLVM